MENFSYIVLQKIFPYKETALSHGFTKSHFEMLGSE